MFNNKNFERLLRIAISISDIKKLRSEAPRPELETEISNLLCNVSKNASFLTDVCEHPGLQYLADWGDMSFRSPEYMEHEFPEISSLATIAVDCACEKAASLPMGLVRRMRRRTE